jgi:18S rRNA (guanine1575-N7)-methyltransferase
LINYLQKGEFYFVADIGCGSGLSSRILSLEKLPWVGTDISLDMLSLAQTDNQEKKQEKDDVKGGGKASGSIGNSSQKVSSPCRGSLTASDMSQGLPFRSNAFDVAISISAVQWLCYNKTSPEKAAQRFFESVWRCLKERDSSSSSSSSGSCGSAAFQVYLESKCCG